MVEEEVRRLSANLKNQVDRTGPIDYVAIYKAMKPLREIYKIEKMEDTDNYLKFIQKDLNLFSVGYQELEEENMQGFITKRINHITNDRINILLMNSNLSKREQRWILARSLGLWLIHYEETRYSTPENCFPNPYYSREEIIADIFARFVLLPFEAVCKEYKIYIGSGIKPKYNVDEWYKYLSIVYRLPKEQASIGWQEIRTLFLLLKEQKI